MIIKKMQETDTENEVTDHVFDDGVDDDDHELNDDLVDDDDDDDDDEVRRI